MCPFCTTPCYREWCPYTVRKQKKSIRKIMKFLFILLFLISCNKKESFVRTYSKAESQYLATLDLESKVIMNDCLKNEYRTVTDCIKRLHEIKNPQTVVKESSDGTILDTMAGAALGYGAAKLLDDGPDYHSGSRHKRYKTKPYYKKKKSSFRSSRKSYRKSRRR